MKFETKSIHGIQKYDKESGGIGTPINLSSTFQIFEFGKEQEFEYSRVSNPTRSELEKLIAKLENGKKGYAFSSGMAAINAVFAMFKAGDHIVTCDDIYGGTYRLITEVFQNFGIEFTFVDATNLDAVKSAIKENTKAIFIETPSNPLLAVTDIRGIATIAKENNLISIIDNTFMTPYLQRPLDLGMDITLHSATKFLGGHSDIIAGLVVASDDEIIKKLTLIQKSTGTMLAPFDSWLLIRSIKTLKIRVDYSQSSTLKIIDYLRSHPLVDKIYYPTESDNKGKAIHESQCDGPGAIFSFTVKSYDIVDRFFKKIELGAFAVSLGGVETLVSHPYTMSHSGMPGPEKDKRGITQTMIRVSIGLEDPEDLIEDFKQALGE